MSAPSAGFSVEPLPPPFNHTSPPPELLFLGAESHLYRTHFLVPTRPCALKYRPPKLWRHPSLDARLTRHRILSEARILARCRKEGVAVPGVLALNWEGGEVDVDVDVAGDGYNEESGGGDGGGVSSRGGGPRKKRKERRGAWMMMEWIEGRTVREALNREFKAQRKNKSESESHAVQSVAQSGDDQPSASREPDRAAAERLMKRIGECIAKLHALGVVHGDLTTSNLMLRRQQHASNTPMLPDDPTTPGLAKSAEAAATSSLSQKRGRPVEGDDSNDGRGNLEGEVVMIDFGLAAITVQEEDRAVDLYVLERAFASTHPGTEDLFGEALKAYGEGFKGAKAVLKRLEEVRMRGRKRSMVG